MKNFSDLKYTIVIVVIVWLLSVINMAFKWRIKILFIDDLNYNFYNKYNSWPV